LKENGDMVTSN